MLRYPDGFFVMRRGLTYHSFTPPFAIGMLPSPDGFVVRRGVGGEAKKIFPAILAFNDSLPLAS